MVRSSLARFNVVLAVALLVVAVSATGPSSAATVGLDAARPAIVAAGAIHTLPVSVSNGTVTGPSRIMAGTYNVHVSTADVSARLQVVRPPSTLTRTRFLSLYAAYTKTQTASAFGAWRTSATFVGGAEVVPHATLTSLRTAAGLGVFAITLSPGRYWLYASGSTGWPAKGTSTRIQELVVVGTATRAAVPVVSVARFGTSGFSVTMPRTIPQVGFILGLGTPGQVSTLRLQRLLPGITDTQLIDGSCFSENIPTMNCFTAPSDLDLGGAVSGGASALWYYRLPQGDYAMSQGSVILDGIIPADRGFASRVTVR